MIINDDDNNNKDDDDNIDDEILRRGCCVKIRARHLTKIHLGGAWNWTFRAERRYLDPKKKYPTISMVSHHLVHLNRHLEVYIIKHIYRREKKNRGNIKTNSNIFLLLRYLWMDARICHFHRTVGYLENDLEKSEFQIE